MKSFEYKTITNSSPYGVGTTPKPGGHLDSSWECFSITQKDKYEWCFHYKRVKNRPIKTSEILLFVIAVELGVALATLSDFIVL
jgi:hypothetical protein